MANNPYSAYKKQENKQPEPLSAAVSHFFEMAANHMQEAANSIKRNDVVCLVQETQKAQDILSGLAENLQPTDSETARIAETLYEYYSTMMILMARMVIKRDLVTCLALEKSLRQMHQCWLTAGDNIIGVSSE